MEVRKLKEMDLRNSFLLSKYAFGFNFTQEEQELYLSLNKAEDTIGCFDADDQLLAHMTVLNLTAWVNDKPISVGGIAGVATWPEFRKSGLLRRMIDSALQSMKNNNQLLAMLHPLSIELYRKFGWEVFVDYKTYTFENLSFLSDFGHSSGYVTRTDTYHETFNKVYNVYLSRYNGMLERDSDWWTNRIFSQKNPNGWGAIYFDSSDRPKGYIIYHIKDEEFIIQELITLDVDAFNGLWGFVKKHDSMLKKIIVKQMPIDDHLPYLLENPRISEVVYPYFMARIVDVELFLKQHRFQSKERKQFHLRISDEVASWNEGVYLIDLDENKQNVMKINTFDTDNRDMFFCDIRTLTSLMLGYHDYNFYKFYNLIQGDAVEIEQFLSCLAIRNKPYLMDFF